MTDVLIVDDEESIRMSMRYVLDDAGYQVFEAADGREAYAVLTTLAAGIVVLLDLAMPGMDGPALLEALKEQSSMAAQHAIIVVSAYATATLPLRVAKLLSDLDVPVLGKPFHIDDLLAAVAKAEQRVKPSRCK
jgi:CheY-like chemotaxis protein